MTNQKKIDNVANLWEKTKDPQYKDLWYKLIKEFNNGFNNTERRNVPSNSGNESNVKRYDDNGQGRLF
jgi:hypothetical protein